MTNILEIQEHLRDTHAAISKLTGASTQSSDSKSKKVVAASLNKRKLRLEQRYKNALSENGIEVCNYRMFGETQTISVRSFTSSLSNFQSLVTLVYDAVKEGSPRSCTQTSLETRLESTFNVGYTFTGNLGLALATTNDNLLSAEGNLDVTLQQIFKIAKSREPQDVMRFSEEMGVACVQAMHKWADGNAQSGLDVQIDWHRGSKYLSSLLIQMPEFQELARITASTR